MPKRLALLFVAFVGGLVGCTAPPRSSTARVPSLISAREQVPLKFLNANPAESDREIVARVLPLLEPYERDNVLIVIRGASARTDREIVSRPNLSGFTAHSAPVAKSSMVRLDEETIVPPPDEEKPLVAASAGPGNSSEVRELVLQGNAVFDFSTGAIHGARTKPGWSLLTADVGLPCESGRFWKIGDTTDETGYIYTGGWGGRTTGPPVDAGFQYSVVHDNYSLIIKYDGDKSIHSFDRLARFECGQTIPIRFSALPNGAIHISARGKVADPKQTEPVWLTIVWMAPAGDRWQIGGGGSSNGIVLKRMTTIAQPPEWNSRRLPPGAPPDRLADGSYFGSHGDGRPLVLWSNVKIGRYNVRTKAWDVRAWEPPDDFSLPKADFPANTGVRKILITRAKSGEFSAIELRPRQGRDAKP